MEFLLTMGAIAGAVFVFVLFELFMKIAEKALDAIDKIGEEKQ